MPGAIAETGGKLTQSPEANVVSAGWWVGVDSTYAYDLTGRSVQVEVAQLPGPTGTQTIFRQTHDGSNSITIGYRFGLLYAEQQVANVWTTLIEIPWPSAPPVRALRFSFETTGWTYWEYSLGGVNFETLYARPTPFPITALKTMLATGTRESVASPGTAIWDNFNLYLAPLTVDGKSDGKATTSAVATRRRPLAATASGLATVTVALTRYRTLLAASAGVSTTTGASRARRSLVGTSAGVAVTTGRFTLSGQSFGRATTTTALIGRRRALGTVTSHGVATVQGGAGGLVTDRFFAAQAPTEGGPETGSYDLGMRFQPTVAGKVTGVALYCPVGGTDQVVSLYHFEGGAFALKARRTMTVLGTGWQEIPFATPADCYDDDQPWFITRYSESASGWSRTYNGAMSVLTSPGGLMVTQLDGGYGWSAYGIGLTDPYVPIFHGDDFGLDPLFAVGAPGGPVQITAYRRLLGASAGLGTPIEILTARRRLVAASAGVATTNARFTLSGRSEGKATVSVLIGRRRPLLASSAGVATTTAVITARRRIVAASSNGVATTTVQIGRRRPLFALSAGTSTTTALLTRIRRLAGATVGQASATGALTAYRRLQATSTGLASVSIAIERLRALYARSDGVASCAGQPGVVKLLYALGVGRTTMLTKVSARRRLVGTSNGQTLMVVLIGRRRTILGVTIIPGRATVAGKTTARRGLFATPQGIASASGTIGVYLGLQHVLWEYHGQQFVFPPSPGLHEVIWDTDADGFVLDPHESEITAPGRMAEEEEAVTP